MIEGELAVPSRRHTHGRRRSQKLRLSTPDNQACWRRCRDRLVGTGPDESGRASLRANAAAVPPRRELRRDRGLLGSHAVRARATVLVLHPDGGWHILRQRRLVPSGYVLQHLRRVPPGLGLCNNLLYTGGRVRRNLLPTVRRRVDRRHSGRGQRQSLVCCRSASTFRREGSAASSRHAQYLLKRGRARKRPPSEVSGT